MISNNVKITLIASILGGLITIINFFSNKEQKDKEMKERWINEFKDEISGLLINSAILLSLMRVKCQEKGIKDNKDFRDVIDYELTEKLIPWFIDAEKFYQKIKLRVGRNEKYKKLNNLIQEFKKTIEENPLDIDKTEKLDECITNEAYEIINSKWKELKKDTYLTISLRLIFYILLVILLILISLII